MGSYVHSINLYSYFFTPCYRVSLIAQLVKNPPAMQETPVWFLGRSAGEGISYPLQYSWTSLVAQLVKNPPAMQETWVLPAMGRSPGKGRGYPFQYSGLENSMNYSPWGYKELDTTKRLSQCWLLTLCKFHMYNIIFLLVYILQHTHYKKCSFHPSPSS